MLIKIKDKIMSIPIVQGGMGIGISMGKLAGAVAREGGIGTISFVNCGYEDENFYKNPKEANKNSFINQVKTAKDIAKGKGIIMVNIMHVVNNLEEYLQFINTTDVDGVVIGAGLPLEAPKYISKEKILAPIVSSARALNLIMKKWIRNFDRLPDFIVFEGPKAGGHLGFKREDFGINMFDELKKIIDVKKQFEKNSIPVFIGGGFGTKDALGKALDSGASGVQIGTGFLFTEESSMEKNTKQRLLELQKEQKIKVDVLQSPVGLPARGMNTKFVLKTKIGRIPSKHCINCISTCNPKTTPYCINEALIRAVKGDLENGLFFAGDDIENIDKIVSVKEYISGLLGGENE